jgi:hypothetical protein
MLSITSSYDVAEKRLAWAPYEPDATNHDFNNLSWLAWRRDSVRTALEFAA